MATITIKTKNIYIKGGVSITTSSRPSRKTSSVAPDRKKDKKTSNDLPRNAKHTTKAAKEHYDASEDIEDWQTTSDEASLASDAPAQRRREPINHKHRQPWVEDDPDETLGQSALDTSFIDDRIDKYRNFHSDGVSQEGWGPPPRRDREVSWGPGTRRDSASKSRPHRIKPFTLARRSHSGW